MDYIQYFSIIGFIIILILSISRNSFSFPSISDKDFINFVGDQLARITPEKNRKSGKLRALMPTLLQGYYYYLPNNTKKGEYGRFNLSTKMKSILNAFEGFFVDSGGCESYFAYGWK